MATRTPKIPPTVHPAFETPKAPEPVAPKPPQRVTGVDVRGPEQRRVPYYIEGGCKFVAAPHEDQGKPW